MGKKSDVQVIPVDLKPEMRVRFPPSDKSFTKKIGNLSIGGKVTIEVTGRVKGLSLDRQFSNELVLDVTSIECYESMGSQVERIRESRKG